MSFLVLQQNTGQLLNHPNLNAEYIVIVLYTCDETFVASSKYFRRRLYLQYGIFKSSAKSWIVKQKQMWLHK